MFPSQLANKFLTYQTFVTNLHPLRVELRCKLQEKLHRVTGPLACFFFLSQLNSPRFLLEVAVCTAFDKVLTINLQQVC